MHGEIAEVVVFFPNLGGAVVEHCRKYTVGYGAIGGGVVVAIGGTVLQAWRGDISRVLQAKVLSWSKLEPPPRVVPMPFEGSAEGKA